MAHINLTLTHEEILALLSDNRDEAFRKLWLYSKFSGKHTP